MAGPFTATKISDHVYWVGAIDWRIRNFHGYSTEHGSTYNAYLVVGEKIALIDTVKAPFREELLARISSVVDPSRIDYIVSNHSEMDHSGCLPEIARLVKPEKILASPMGVKTLSEHFAGLGEVTPVQEGEEVSLGDLTMAFVGARMLHWPESMFTYLVEEGVLFAQDAFGMHLASFERFADEIPEETLWREAAKYYANILLPYSGIVAKAVGKLPDTPIGQARVIAPDHGPIWRKDIWRIASRYAGWAAQKPTPKAVVVYDTMWESTAAMAAAIAEGLLAGGARPCLVHLGTSDRSVLATEVLAAGALLVGSPTINNQIFPTLADALSYLKGLKPKNLIGAAFGSYGWSGEGVAQAEDALRAMKVELVGEGFKVMYVPTGADLERCRRLGATVAGKLLEVCHGE
jgi:flavorubredoxin